MAAKKKTGTSRTDKSGASGMGKTASGLAKTAATRAAEYSEFKSRQKLNAPTSTARSYAKGRTRNEASKAFENAYTSTLKKNTPTASKKKK